MFIFCLQNQIRDANLKNAQNHQYNNIYQYIVQMQKENQELHNQVADLTHNGDVKQLEIEKLHKKVKKQEALLQKQDSLEYQDATCDGENKEKDVGDQLDGCKDTDKDLKIKDEIIDDDLCKDDEKEESKVEDQRRPTSSSEADLVFDSQPGPSGELLYISYWIKFNLCFAFLGLCPPVSISVSGFSDWDKQSCSSMSELSVANLQDRINQMEETHYSTSEELQATLQELNDMHDQVSELQLLSEQLELDKTFLLETLCAQTKKLEICLEKIQRMQKLLLDQYDSEEKRTLLSASDREVELTALLKTSDTEKEDLEVKKNDLCRALEDMRAKYERADQERYDLYEKFR